MKTFTRILLFTLCITLFSACGKQGGNYLASSGYITFFKQADTGEVYAVLDATGYSIRSDRFKALSYTPYLRGYLSFSIDFDNQSSFSQDGIYDATVSNVEVFPTQTIADKVGAYQTGELNVLGSPFITYYSKSIYPIVTLEVSVPRQNTGMPTITMQRSLYVPRPGDEAASVNHNDTLWLVYTPTDTKFVVGKYDVMRSSFHLPDNQRHDYVLRFSAKESRTPWSYIDPNRPEMGKYTTLSQMLFDY